MNFVPNEILYDEGFPCEWVKYENQLLPYFPTSIHANLSNLHRRLLSTGSQLFFSSFAARGGIYLSEIEYFLKRYRNPEGREAASRLGTKGRVGLFPMHDTDGWLDGESRESAEHKFM